MKTYPGVRPTSTTVRHTICFGAALSTLCAAVAHAQQAGSPDRTQTDIHAFAGGAQACLDPAGVMVRRRLQDEACKLPMVRLPLLDVVNSGELPRWHTPATDRAHAMFWRFPVQGRGPQEVPRHSWR